MNQKCVKITVKFTGVFKYMSSEYVSAVRYLFIAFSWFQYDENLSDAEIKVFVLHSKGLLKYVLPFTGLQVLMG